MRWSVCCVACGFTPSSRFGGVYIQVCWGRYAGSGRGELAPQVVVLGSWLGGWYMYARSPPEGAADTDGTCMGVLLLASARVSGSRGLVWVGRCVGVGVVWLEGSLVCCCGGCGYCVP